MAEKKTPETEAELTEVLRVRREKLAQLVEDGKDPFQITKFDVTHHSAEIKDDFDALEGKEVVVAGRMMSKRVMGKASFCNVQDLKGGIQCYVARDAVGEDSYKDFKKFDIGDVIGVRGEVFKTKTGEISIHAALEEPAGAAGEVPRPDEHRYALPPEIRRSHREPGSEGHVCKALEDH